MSTLVIAEIGSCHDNSLDKAKRLIDAAKECGANVAKGQWTSNAEKMAQRRGLGKDAAAMYAHYLQKPISWLEALKAHCDSIGIEWACTSYLIEDIAKIAPLVKRFKVSAFECEWREFLEAHPCKSDLIISMNPGKYIPPLHNNVSVDVLHCISEYPTPLEHLKLGRAEIGSEWWKSGLSDHTTSTLTGALAVAAGATIIEKHIRLHDTSKDCPDYPHSLCADEWSGPVGDASMLVFNTFKTYVANIREAERAL